MLISKELIQLDADYQTKEELIEAVAKLLDEKERLYSLEGYIQAVNEREAEVSTNLGDGIGMPHARTDTVKEASLVFVRLKEPIVWGDEKPVRIVFQIAVPNNSGNLHLKILSQLARHLVYEEFKNRLLQVKSEEELLTIISEATGGII